MILLINYLRCYLIRYLVAVVAICTFFALTGCSALIVASAKNEEDIIYPGVTKADLSKKLGEPLDLKIFDHPILAQSIEGEKGKNGVAYTIPQYLTKRGPEVHTSLDQSSDEVIEKAYYRFNGRLRRESDTMDIAQSVIYGIGTLGITELFFTPLAVADPFKTQPDALVVWFEKSGRARAYQWVWSKPFWQQ